MALDPLELIAIGGVIVVILVWGPSKIPEFAKTFGQAKKEFDMAQKQFQQLTKEFQTQAGLTGAASTAGGTSLIERFASMGSQPQQPQQTAPASAPASAPALPSPGASQAPATAAPLPEAQAGNSAPAADSRSADEVLIATAKELGIVTEGKTREEISKEIVAKAKSATPSAQ